MLMAYTATFLRLRSALPVDRYRSMTTNAFHAPAPRRTGIRCVAALLVMAAAAWCAAQDTAPRYASAANIPVSEFFRQARYSQMAMSPDGKRLAALAPISGRDNLVVIDLEKRVSTTVTNLDYVDVADFLWLNDQRIFFRTSDRQLETGVQQRYGGYFAVDIDGSNSRNLSPDRKQLRIFAAARDGSSDLIVGKRVDSRSNETVLRINTRTGRSGTLTFNNPGDVTDWAIDRNGAVRAAQRMEPRAVGATKRRKVNLVGHLVHRYGINPPRQHKRSDDRFGLCVDHAKATVRSKRLAITGHIDTLRRAVDRESLRSVATAAWHQINCVRQGRHRCAMGKGRDSKAHCCHQENSEQGHKGCGTLSCSKRAHELRNTHIYFLPRSASPDWL